MNIVKNLFIFLLLSKVRFIVFPFLFIVFLRRFSDLKNQIIVLGIINRWPFIFLILFVDI